MCERLASLCDSKMAKDERTSCIQTRTQVTLKCNLFFLSQCLHPSFQKFQTLNVSEKMYVINVRHISFSSSQFLQFNLQQLTIKTITKLMLTVRFATKQWAYDCIRSTVTSCVLEFMVHLGPVVNDCSHKINLV